VTILREFMRAAAEACRQEIRAHQTREARAATVEMGPVAAPGAQRTVRVGGIYVAVDAAFVMMIGYQVEETDR